MHFLVDASLPTATSDFIRAAGHQATDVRDIGLGEADDEQIAQFAQLHAMCLISADNDFGSIQVYPPERYPGIVVIQPPHPSNRTIVLNLVADLFLQVDIVANLCGRLALVAPGRIRVRPGI